jgi:hypothetical protein
MTAHNIPDTPEIREKIDKIQADSLKRMGLETNKVAIWEDGYRASKDEANTFEWWYFDMQLDDGSTFVVTFTNKPHTQPNGPIKPSVLLIYRGTKGQNYRKNISFKADQFSSSTLECDVKIGCNNIKGDLKTYKLHIEEDRFVIDLKIERKAPSWRPGAGISYFNSSKSEYLGWVVPVPYGIVNGTIVDKGVSRKVKGSAYHDHNWGNKVMNSMLDHWYWGRAHIEDFTVVYVRMTTKGLFGFGSVNIPTIMLAKGNRIITDDMIPLRLKTSGDKPGPGQQTYPTDLLWTWKKGKDTISMHITNPQMIESLDMLDDTASWKKPIIHLFEHPMYYDFNADMKLSININSINETVVGRTLYEKMMFR